MIRNIVIRNLGPHAETRVDLPDGPGPVVLEARSEAGKSTALLDAPCFALWGEDRFGRPLPSDAIRDGESTAVVRLGLTSGALVHRELEIGEGGGRKHVRAFVGKNGERSYSTEKDWQANALGPLGRDRDLLRLIMVGGWERLALGEGGGRPLRDALLRATARSAVDVREVVARLMREMNYELLERDTVDPAAVEAKRKSARKAADAAAGARDQARLGREVAAARKVNPPTRKQIEDAQLALTMAASWARYDEARAAYDEASRLVDGHAEAVAAWREAASALGEHPAAPRDLAGARERARVAEAALAEATRADERATDKLERLLRAVDEAEVDVRQLEESLEAATIARDEPVEVSDQCPTCHRHGWDGAREARARGLAAAVEEGLLRLANRRAERDDAIDELEVAKVERSVTEGALARAESEATIARKAVADLERQDEALREWERRSAELGAEPTASGLPPKPAEPQLPRPTDVKAAQAVLDEAKRCQGEERRIEADLAELDKAVDVAEREAVRTELEALRLDALVEAVRQAPSVALMQQLEALGDLGPVSFEPTEHGGLDVLIDGRHWERASDGKKDVVAGMWIRAAIRRAMKLEWLPIIVDQVQDLAGQPLPEVRGQLILLRTADVPWRVVGREATQEAA